MEEELHEYRGSGLKVTWDKRRCIHVGACVRGLPAVFDTSQRPWIQPDAGEREAVIRTVEACPTGALQYTAEEDGVAEDAPPRSHGQIRPDGPLFLAGRLRVETADGEVLCRDTRLALCRCGASRNKPFCDGRHRDAGFSDPGKVSRPQPEGDCGEGELTLTLAENGPVIARGPLELAEPSGEVTFRGEKAALCRCGASSTKPFCDGSHTAAGFEAE